VREPDGTLREGHWDERDRINFLFFQREGQTYKMSSVLEDEHLEVCIQGKSNVANQIGKATYVNGFQCVW
jgi:hypothetical protein